MNNTGNEDRQVNNCHGCNGLTVIKKTAEAIAAWSNGVSQERLIGVGFGSTGRNSNSDEKKSRPLKSERRIWDAANFTKKVFVQDRCILKTKR